MSSADEHAVQLRRVAAEHSAHEESHLSQCEFVGLRKYPEAQIMQFKFVVDRQVLQDTSQVDNSHDVPTRREPDAHDRHVVAEEAQVRQFVSHFKHVEPDR